MAKWPGCALWALILTAWEREAPAGSAPPSCMVLMLQGFTQPPPWIPKDPQTLLGKHPGRLQKGLEGFFSLK